MNLDYIEDLIDRENINLIDTYLEDTAGAYVNYDKLNVILYDSSKCKTSIDKKDVLAEELGHYYMDSVYKFNSNLQFINKQEYRAKKWKSTTLITKNALFKALKKGCNTFYEVAEELCVKEDTVKFAYNYYKENGLISTNEEVLQNSI